MHTYAKQVFYLLRSLFQFIEYLFGMVPYRIFGLGELEEESMAGKVALVTGSNTGIGKEVARALAARGATVILACRNLKAGVEAVRDIKNDVAGAKLELMKLDLSDLNSVRKFAQDVKARFPEIHLLMNNAGVCSFKTELQKTKQGFELHMGVNHLAHFLLTNLLLDNLKAGAPSRVAVVSSSTILSANLKLNDLMMEKCKDPCIFTGISRLPYNNSKFANALFAKELARRLEGTGVTVTSFCPGIVKTAVFRDSAHADKLFTSTLQVLGAITTKQALEGVLHCALSRKCEHESGKFYRFGEVHRGANRMLKAKDAEELWTISEKLVSEN